MCSTNISWLIKSFTYVKFYDNRHTHDSHFLATTQVDCSQKVVGLVKKIKLQLNKLIKIEGRLWDTNK